MKGYDSVYNDDGELMFVVPRYTVEEAQKRFDLGLCGIGTLYAAHQREGHQAYCDGFLHILCKHEDSE